jgi:hypothetical protein
MDPDNPYGRLALTHSLFPGTRRMLAGSEFLIALYSVAPSDIRKPYRDAVDFLFCELLIGYKDLCARFYRGESPPLCALPIATPERTERWDILLMGALLYAGELRKRRNTMEWERFRNIIIEAATAPG